MPSGLRAAGSGQVVIEVGEHSARDMRCGKFLASPVRTWQIVAAIDNHRRRASRCGERRGQLAGSIRCNGNSKTHFPITIIPTAL